MASPTPTLGIPSAVVDSQAVIDTVTGFMSLRGRRIVYVGGRAWYGRAGGHYGPVAPEDGSEPSASEVSRMLRDEAAVAARYRTASTAGIDIPRYVCREVPVLASELEHKVAEGLDRMYFRRVTHQELIIQGHQLNVDTLGRQSRSDRELTDPRLWWQFGTAVNFTPGVEAHGVFEGGELAGYLVMLAAGRKAHILQQASRDSLAHLFPNDTLTHSVARMALGRPDIREIDYGGGLYGGVPLDTDFFESHGFHRESRLWRITLNPRLERVFSTPPLTQGVRLLASAFPRSHRLAYLDAALELSQPARPLS